MFTNRFTAVAAIFLESDKAFRLFTKGVDNTDPLAMAYAARHFLTRGLPSNNSPYGELLRLSIEMVEWTEVGHHLSQPATAELGGGQ